MKTILVITIITIAINGDRQEVKVKRDFGADWRCQVAKKRYERLYSNLNKEARPTIKCEAPPNQRKM